MNTKFFILILFLIATPFRMFADKDKAVLPPVENSWNDYKADGDRSLSSAPSLLKDANFVYVYSEKQLDNLTIGITDMMGNVYHEEVTTVPVGVYYAISIESLPEGMYYLCVYQGSNYVIGIFQKTNN